MSYVELRRPALEGRIGVRRGSDVERASAAWSRMRDSIRDLPDEPRLQGAPTEHEIERYPTASRTIAARSSIRCCEGTGRRGLGSEHFLCRMHTSGQLVPFLERVIRIQPLLRASELVAQEMAGFGLRGGDPAIARISTAMERLFCAPAPPLRNGA